MIYNYVNSPTRFQQQFTDHQLIQNFIDAEYDLNEMENLFSDMLLNYVYPSSEHRLSPEHTRAAIERGNVILELLRGIRNQKNSLGS